MAARWARSRRLTSLRAAQAEALRLATNRYRAGYSPYYEELDAQRGLPGADLALAQSRADRLNALIALFQSVGGGWEIAPAAH